jgi:hypothetical protein
MFLFFNCKLKHEEVLVLMQGTLVESDWKIIAEKENTIT